MVFLYLQLYKHNSLKLKGSHKLALHFYGPYKILQCIGPTTYKLELPASSKIHPIFYVLCLKQVLGSQTTIQIMLPEFTEEGSILIEPEVVLDRHTCQLHNYTIIDVLIH